MQINKKLLETFRDVAPSYLFNSQVPTTGTKIIQHQSSSIKPPDAIRHQNGAKFKVTANADFDRQTFVIAKNLRSGHVLQRAMVAHGHVKCHGLQLLSPLLYHMPSLTCGICTRNRTATFAAYLFAKWGHAAVWV